MEETIEKSCWGITFWAVAIVVGAMVVVGLFSGADTTAATTAETPESIKITSK